MLSIGDGIAVGCAVLGAVLVVWRLASARNTGNNPSGNSKYVLQRACDANVQAMNRQLDALSDLVTKGFDELRASIRGMHERMDRARDRNEE